MKLEPSKGLRINLEDRFAKEVRTLPEKVRLEGNAMHVAIAKNLLEGFRHVEIAEDGELVQLCSMESYGTRMVRALIRGDPVPEGLFLLRTLPEELLVAYAEKQGIEVIPDERDDVRELLDAIAEEQPQTYYSLERSAERLLPMFAALPETKE